MNDILIQNRKILDTITGLDHTGDLSIANGKIKEVGDAQDAEAVQTVDASGCYVIPGLINYRQSKAG